MQMKFRANQGQIGLTWLSAGILFISLVSMSAAQTSRPFPAPSHLAKTVIEQDGAIDVGHDKIIGTLSLPATGTTFPAVLILHGFAPERDGIPVRATQEGMFSRPARQWAEQGYATLRISTRGSGGSGGSYENMTIEGRIEEAMAAVAWLASQSNIDPHKIGILGYNQGAIVATATAGRMHDTPTIKSIALWLPIINPLFYYGNRSGVSQLADGLNAKHGELVPLTTKSKTSRPLKTGFYRDIWTISPAAELRSFDGSMLVAIGTKEAEDVPKASAEALLRYHHGPHQLVSFPTDQGIGVFEGSETLDELAARTLEWFKKQL